MRCGDSLSKTRPDARSAEIPTRQDSLKRSPERTKLSLLLSSPFSPSNQLPGRVGGSQNRCRSRCPCCNAVRSSRERVRRASCGASRPSSQPFRPSSAVSPTCTNPSSLFLCMYLFTCTCTCVHEAYMNICLASARSYASRITQFWRS